MIKKVRYLIAFLLLITLVYSTVTLAAQSKSAKVAVFKFEGSNIDEGILNAAREIFSASMVKEGFALVDNQLVDQTYEQMSSAPVQITEPPVPSSVESSVLESDTDNNAAAANDSDSESKLDKASKTAEKSTQAKPVQPKIQTESQPVLTSADKVNKRDVAQSLGCDVYVSGKLVKLGRRTQVYVTMYRVNGDTVDSKNMTAMTEDDLNLIFERIATAFAKGLSPEATRNYDNATVAETSIIPNYDKINSNHGFTLGGGILFHANNKKRNGTVSIAYEGIWEYKALRAGINAGFAMSAYTANDTYNDDFFFAVKADLLIGAFLSKGMIEPYLSGGIGAYLGTRPTGDGYYDDDANYKTPAVAGFEFFPAFGVELLRRSRMRLHPEIRYLLIVDMDGKFAHGPMLNIGLNF